MEMDTINALAEAMAQLSEEEMQELIKKVAKLEKILHINKEHVYIENYL